jgi:hypothetical protein
LSQFSCFSFFSFPDCWLHSGFKLEQGGFHQGDQPLFEKSCYPAMVRRFKWGGLRLDAEALAFKGGFRKTIQAR